MTITPNGEGASIEWGPEAADAGATYYILQFSDNADGTDFYGYQEVYEPDRSYTKSTLSPLTTYYVRLEPRTASDAPMPAYTTGWVEFTTTDALSPAVASIDALGLFGHESGVLNVYAGPSNTHTGSDTLLAAYTFVGSDASNVTNIANHVVAAINGNTGTTDFSAVNNTGNIVVFAPLSAGSSYNGNYLKLVYSGGSLTTVFFGGTG